MIKRDRKRLRGKKGFNARQWEEVQSLKWWKTRKISVLLNVSLENEPCDSLAQRVVSLRAK